MPNPNVTVSPNMSLPVPDLTDPGSDYATNVNTSLNTIDAHTHTGAPTGGLQLDLSTQLVKGDIAMGGHNLGGTRSVEFQSQPGALDGSQDVNCLYVNAGVLGFNNAAGTFIPLGNSSNVAQFQNFPAITVTTSRVVLATDTYTLINCNSPGASITITLPRAATILPIPQWRLYVIRDIGENAATHPITIQVTGGSGDTFRPGAGTSITLNSACGYVAVVTDGVSVWSSWDQNTYNLGEILQFNTGANLKLVGATMTLDAATSVTNTGTTINDVAVSHAVLGGLLQIASSATLDISGSTMAVHDTTTMAFDPAMAASSGKAVKNGVANVTLTATTGLTTLSNVQYNQPIISIATATLTGDITINFPSIVGACWKLDTSKVTLAGHAIAVSVGADAPQTLKNTQIAFEVWCTSATAFVIFTSGT